MSYQRWGKPGRFYVWASHDALHVWPVGADYENGGVKFTNDVAGRDNAESVLRGCVDHLASLGIAATVKAGKVKFEKRK